MSPTIIRHHPKSAHELLDMLDPGKLDVSSAARWKRNFFGMGGLIFRGQPNAKWKISASAFRKSNLDRFCSEGMLNIFSDALQGRDVEHQLRYHMMAELQAVRFFIEEADRFGNVTSLDYNEVKTAIRDIDELPNTASIYANYSFPRPGMFKDFALAQHHGIPTRFTDWTEDPLIACYFAAYKASSVSKDDGKIASDSIAVYSFNTTKNVFDDSGEFALVRVPRRNNGYLSAQKGLFIAFTDANLYYDLNGTWPTIDEIIEADPVTYTNVLTKYTLKSDQADELLRLLHLRNITRHSLMPSLDNIAQAMPYDKALEPWI